VSPWLRRQWLVTLSPREVTLLPIQRTLGLRGPRRTAGEPRTLACAEPGGAAPWRPALQALEAAMSDMPARKAAVTVFLSNHFLRYAIVPWRDELAAGEEEMAWARHCFTRLYGSAAAQWEIRLNPLPQRAARLACALDAELIEELRAVCARSGSVLCSVQPQLMTAFNSSRRQLGQCSAWLAMPEPGHVCLALLDQGQWLRIRGLRIDGRWQDELPQLLEREALLSDGPTVPHEVYIWNVSAGEVELLQRSPWHLHAIAPDAGAHQQTATAG
jgi:hypothetical protein